MIIFATFLLTRTLNPLQSFNRERARKLRYATIACDIAVQALPFQGGPEMSAVKIGLLMPRSGLAGLWTPSTDATAAIAVAELNAEGGILGDEVDLTVADCGLTIGEAVTAADFLLEVEDVDAVVGLHTSNVRDAISARLAGRVPYIYSVQYEGVRCGPSTVATGSVDHEILWPAINWLMDSKHAERFYFVGNDYIWPRSALELTKTLIAQRGAHLVGQAFAPLSDVDHSGIIDDIVRQRPHVVIQMLIGQAAIDFNRAFSERGLDTKMLRFGLAIDDTVLCGIGAENSHNLYAGGSYFSSWRSGPNERFLELYHEAFGAYAPPVSAMGVSAYEGINVVAGLARKAGGYNGRKMADMLRRPMSRAVARHALARSPIGEVPHTHIAAADGVVFNIVSSTQ
jgi:ABC-type branched-subunit amino acid transport system substrate-binding protein